MRIEGLLAVVINLYVFFLCSDLSTAGYNISCAILALCGIVFYMRLRRLPSLLFSVKSFYVLYFIFFSSIMISAILLGNKTAIEQTFDYVLLSVPMWILLFSLYIKKNNDWGIWWGYFSAAIVLISFSLYSFAILPWETRIMGPFSNPNRFAMVLEILIPFLIAIWGHMQLNKRVSGFKYTFVKGLMVLIVMAAIFAMLLTQSRGGIGGLIFGIITVIAIKYLQQQGINNTKVKICIMFSILTIFFSGIAAVTIGTFHRTYDNERILLLKSTYQMWNDHKLYGVGMGNWKELYQQKYILPEAKEPDLPFPHNNAASFFSMTGTVGGLGYLLFSFGSLMFLIKKIDECPDNYYLYAMVCVSVAVFSHGIVDNTLYNKFIVRMFFGMWGITLASLQYYPLKK